MDAMNSSNNTTIESHEFEERNYNNYRITRKGAWSLEEDYVLTNYIAVHGEGRWDYLACNAGLKRSGKSCRLRWLNYLRPNLRHGNFTPDEQFRIILLHYCHGNRWSKIAQHLPGRTDNDIKNYWRTRVQKQAKRLKCDINSVEFNDFVLNVWLPRLHEHIQASKAHATVNRSDEIGMIDNGPEEALQMDYWANSGGDALSELTQAQFYPIPDNLLSNSEGFTSGLDYGPELFRSPLSSSCDFQGSDNQAWSSSEGLSDMLQPTDDLFWFEP